MKITKATRWRVFAGVWLQSLFTSATAYFSLFCIPLTTKFGMIADSIEYGEYKTGTRAEGFVYSAASLGVRVGSALASAVIGWVLGAYGYDGKLAVQSESAMKGIRIMFYYAPLVVFIAILALLFFYKLDREYDGIMKVLDERHKKQEEAAA